MNVKYLEPTGTIIREYLDEVKITQKELAIRIGSSEKHISNVLNGNARLTEEFALKLEKILVDIPASYWLNYESKYREYLARQEEILKINNWNLDDISKRFRFSEVFKDLGLSLTEQAIEMLKLLKISDFDNFDKTYNNLAVDFMEDGGEKEAIAIWLNLCEEEIEIQNDDIEHVVFDKNKLEKSLNKFKILSNNNNTDASIRSCRKLCNKLGIYLVFCESITNSKVRGALTTYKGHPVIYISGRFKSHSHIWFAFMHEIGHLILHYNQKDIMISMEEDDETHNVKELEANKFARDFFVKPDDYNNFIMISNGNFTKELILEFSKKQDVLPEFVVARLQHDKKIEYSKFNWL